jgi:hypothetical protein
MGPFGRNVCHRDEDKGRSASRGCGRISRSGVRRGCSALRQSRPVCPSRSIRQDKIACRDQIEIERPHSPALQSFAPELRLDLVQHMQEAMRRDLASNRAAAFT